MKFGAYAKIFKYKIGKQIKQASTRLFYKEKVYKKMRLKWPKSEENLKAKYPKLSVFVGQKSILHHYYIQNVKGGIQIRVYTIKKESTTHFSPVYISKS